MERLIFFLGVIIGTTILNISCKKQNDIALPQQSEETDLKAQQQYTICHIDDDGIWHVISVNENALPGHMGHGDMYHFDFPEAGTSYNLILGGTSVSMYVDQVTETSFTGNGTHGDFGDFEIEDGSIYENGSVSFTMGFTDSDLDLYIIGSFECGIGIAGSATDIDGNELEWTGYYGGATPEENGLIEVSP
jgi:hypothetical protein